MPKIPAPAKLGAKARRVWEELTADYEFRADELRVLEDACREIDLIERLEREQRDAPLVVEGSQGQPVASPLVQELRQHRAVLSRLFAALKLPDEVPGESLGVSPQSSAGRALASVRWHRGA